MALERLQKILASAGYASRRKAEELITGGRISVNGETVTTLGSKADLATDDVRVDGKRIQGAEQHVYIMLYKPREFVTTVSDPEGRATVMDLVRDIRERIFPIGRLDFNSEGLLLLTNDGDLMQELTAPTSHVPKTYLVKVSGQPSEEQLDRLRAGIKLPAEPSMTKGKGRKRPGESRRSFAVTTLPSKVEIVREGDNPWYEITLTEGRNRQIRRMFEEIGHHVEKIKRVRYGPLSLNVEPGKWRPLSPVEVSKLRASLKKPLNIRPPKREDADKRDIQKLANRVIGKSKGYSARRTWADRPPKREFGDRPPRREFSDRPPRPASADSPVKPEFGDKPPRREFSDRPPRRESGDRPPRKDFGDRPPRRDATGRPPKREWTARPPRRESSDRPPRREFSDRPPRKDFGDRPPRKDFGDRPRTGGFSRGPKREGGFSRGPKREGGFSSRPKREGGFSSGPRTVGGFDGRPPREGGYSSGPKREGGFSRGPRREGGSESRPPREGGFSRGPKRPGGFSKSSGPKREGGFSRGPRREGGGPPRSGGPKRPGGFGRGPKRDSGPRGGRK
jgi:23S rRNA pseudouridine2605 synthase